MTNDIVIIVHGGAVTLVMASDPKAIGTIRVLDKDTQGFSEDATMVEHDGERVPVRVEYFHASELNIKLIETQEEALPPLPERHSRPSPASGQETKMRR